MFDCGNCNIIIECWVKFQLNEIARIRAWIVSTLRNKETEIFC